MRNGKFLLNHFQVDKFLVNILCWRRSPYLNISEEAEDVIILLAIDSPPVITSLSLDTEVILIIDSFIGV